MIVLQGYVESQDDDDETADDRQHTPQVKGKARALIRSDTVPDEEMGLPKLTISNSSLRRLLAVLILPLYYADA